MRPRAAEQAVLPKNVGTAAATRALSCALPTKGTYQGRGQPQTRAKLAIRVRAPRSRRNVTPKAGPGSVGARDHQKLGIRCSGCFAILRLAVLPALEAAAEWETDPPALIAASEWRIVATSASLRAEVASSAALKAHSLHAPLVKPVRANAFSRSGLVFLAASSSNLAVHAEAPFSVLSHLPFAATPRCTVVPLARLLLPPHE